MTTLLVCQWDPTKVRIRRIVALERFPPCPDQRIRSRDRLFAAFERPPFFDSHDLSPPPTTLTTSSRNDA
ncbi:hypothetical protein QWA68_015164 [Fusarium oxysporum]|nr:hypothetical protein QWA68_015164 [Fusarium oxysporum]